jgi:hypothetical protein
MQNTKTTTATTIKHTSNCLTPKPPNASEERVEKKLETVIALTRHETTRKRSRIRQNFISKQTR